MKKFVKIWVKELKRHLFELAQIDQGTLDSALLAIADAVEAQTDEIMAANQLGSR